jgi:hypothetical protein
MPILNSSSDIATERIPTENFQMDAMLLFYILKENFKEIAYHFNITDCTIIASNSRFHASPELL